jgi:glycine oxidase
METVLVVGGGVIGGAVAFALSRRGLKVTLIERGHVEPSRAIGRGPEGSSAAAGILGAQLEGLQGDGPLTRLCLDSRARYPVWVEAIRALSGSDVEFRPAGALEVAFEASALAALQRDAAWQREAGLPVEQLDAAGVRALEPSLSTDVVGGVRFPDDPRIDPPSLLAALRVAAERSGVIFRAETTVARVLTRSGRASGVVLADGTTIESDAVVITAGSWSTLIGDTSLSDDAVMPVRGQIVELKLPAPVLRGVVEGPRCYFSPRDDGRILVGSTLEFVGFRGGATAAVVRDLLAAAIHLLPALGDATVIRTWSGFRPRSTDERPLIGFVNIEGLVIATGHFRNGVLLAPITGEIVAALLTGEAPPVDLGPFNPLRQMAPIRISAPRG